MNTRVTAQPKPAATSGPPMRSHFLQRKCACGGSLGPTGECEECRRKREGGIPQRKVAQPSSFNHQHSEVPPIVQEMLNSAGEPLDPATRAFMEPRFGHDFGHVRVHTDAKAAESARAVHAHAYTVGHNVVFGHNDFAPETHQGRELLAHELAHTIQQRSAWGEAQPLAPGSALEVKAEQAGRDVASGRALGGPLGSSALAVACQLSTEESEEEEEEELTPVPMALPTGKAARVAPSPKPGSRKPLPRRGPPSKFEPGGFPYHFAEGGRILTEEEWKFEATSREEQKEAEATKQKRLEESRDRLQILRGMLDPSRTGYIYTKAQIMAMITKDSLLDGQILGHYGVELPPGLFTKRKTFTNDVIDAIDKFDSERRHAAPVLSATDVKGLQARQSQQENEAAGWEGYSYTTESALAGAGASTTRLFTDDPKKIAAGAGIGAAISGTVGSVATGKATQIEQAAIRESSRTEQNPPAAAAPKVKTEPAPTPDPATKRETIADFVKRGGVIKQVKKGPEPKTVTAQPKSGPTTPEGFGDIFEQTGISEAKTPGGKAPKPKTEAGQVAHKYSITRRLTT